MGSGKAENTPQRGLSNASLIKAQTRETARGKREGLGKEDMGVCEIGEK